MTKSRKIGAEQERQSQARSRLVNVSKRTIIALAFAIAGTNPAAVSGFPVPILNRNGDVSQQTSRRSYQSNAVTTEAARLSNLVYDFTKPDGYEWVVPPLIGSNGFQAAAYKNKSTGRVFVVYAGSNDNPITGKDWQGNRELVRETRPGLMDYNGSPTLDSQTEQAKKFFEMARENSDTTDIVVTGHSQGGYHAQIVGAKYAVTTRTVDAPGVPQSALDRHGIIVGSSLDMVNVVRDSSPISNWTGDHIGQTVKYEDVGLVEAALILPNHASKTFADDVTTDKGTFIPNWELEQQRANEAGPRYRQRANKIDTQERLHNLPEERTFENFLQSMDTSYLVKEVSDYKRETTEESGRISLGINAKWTQAEKQLAKDLAQIRKRYEDERVAMAKAGGTLASSANIGANGISTTSFTPLLNCQEFARKYANEFKEAERTFGKEGSATYNCAAINGEISRRLGAPSAVPPATYGGNRNGSSRSKSSTPGALYSCGKNWSNCRIVDE